MNKILLILSLLVITSLSLQAQGTRNIPSNDDGKTMVFYPNPATTVLNIDIKGGVKKGSSIQIHNFLGKKVKDIQNPAEKNSLNLSDYPRGVYIIRLVDATGKVLETSKFQVAK
ncbi:T9SS type A sorting domain-containing protein [Terrimonas rubra]|uniref:T9SS type A sorting domain-containing protein n=1 Tax=Terrimonas rubra TaxID=1035890 RepID=A0ABW6A3V5_9BACT